MREKESRLNDGYPDMPQLYGDCIVCGKATANYSMPFVCIWHAFEKVECGSCPAKNCEQCKIYGKNLYCKIKYGGWRP